MDAAERILDIVIDWDYFAKEVVGQQLLKAIDSVVANLSEVFLDIFIKRIDSFVIIQEVHYLKQKPG